MCGVHESLGDTLNNMINIKNLLIKRFIVSEIK